ncbi:MAG: alpha/beta hydrolase [Limisphaerales bacterium]
MPLLKLALAALALLALGYGVLRLFERVAVYHPFRRMDGSPADVGLAFEDVWLTARDGVRIHGWFLPAPTNAPAVRARLAVVVAHGNGGNISHRLGLYGLLHRLGLNVLAFDYRGYGRSEGRPTEAGTYLDAEAASDWLEQRGFARGRIIAFGESLGGGVASELARRRPGLGGLVLQSSFTSIPDVGAERYPFLLPRLLARIRYDTRSKLPQLNLPVLILHGRGDTLIGFHHAEANFAAAAGPRWLHEIAGDHNDPPDLDAAAYLAGWSGFLDAVAMEAK